MLEPNMSRREMNVMRHRKLGLLALGAILGAMLLAGLASFVPNLQADQGFTARSLRGTYGFSSSATVLPPFAPSAIPATVVGILTFNGNGGCAVTETINAGGASFSQDSISCSYSVGPDGRGTLSAQSPSGTTPLALVVVDSGKEIRFIRMDQAVASGVATKQ